jgi:hypothetical protein
VVEEGRERVGAAQGTGKVQWGVAFIVGRVNESLEVVDTEQPEE